MNRRPVRQNNEQPFSNGTRLPWMGGNARQYPKCRREKVAALATPVPAGAIMNARLSAAHHNLNS